MKPKILFLTNRQNDAPQEDEQLATFLSGEFDLAISHPVDCVPHLSSAEGVIIRNIWPTHAYREDWENVKNYIRDYDLPTYNPLGLKGDIEGKNYLVVLHEKGYPVIPSIDRVADLHKLPQVRDYWIKPKFSCDGIGARKVTRESLVVENPKGYIIQPFLEFEYEASFFFIDNEYHHAFREQHRLLDDRVQPYTATLQDLTFAKAFVEWAALPYGIQRIDAIRTIAGDLLLTEIEDLSPYLYIAEVEEKTRASFLKEIRASMKNIFLGDK